MPTLRRQSTGKLLLLHDDQKLGGGGEGEVYRVLNVPSLVAKVYFPNKSSGKEPKLKAMLANPPANPTESINHTSIAWPEDLLLNAAGKVTGYLMPNAQGMEKIFGFYVPPDRQQNHLGFTYQHLLNTAKNLASAISALHNAGYVIGDVNESNVMVKDTSLVTLIDTDSFQVPGHKGQVYRSEVGKEEFTPPELQGVLFSTVNRQPEHDLFGLGVLIFQLLMEGVHPFDGKFLGAGDPPPIGERIKQGYFPYSQSRAVPFQPKPIAPPFAMLSPAIQLLFLKCFEEGHRNPQARPTAWTWRYELRKALDDLTHCRSNSQHYYHKSLTNCPWCERVGRFGIDFFSPPGQATTTQRKTQSAKTNQAAQQTAPPPPTITAPVINYFRASNNSITAGQAITLSWDVANAQSVSITGIGNVAARGSNSVSPTTNTTYVIEARNGPHLITSSVSVTVNPAPPAINYFRANSNSITVGQSLILSWDVANAQSVNITGIGNVPAQGSMLVSPTANTTYVIEARNGPHLITSSVSVIVKPPTPVIALFQASSKAIHIGQHVTLQWQVNHAHTVELDNGIGIVPQQGSRVVQPQADTTYTLTARGQGGLAQRHIKIKVSVSLVPPVSLKSPSVALNNPIKLQRQTVSLHAVSTTLPPLPQLSPHSTLNPVSVALLKPVPLFRPVIIAANAPLTASRRGRWHQRFRAAMAFLGRLSK